MDCYNLFADKIQRFRVGNNGQASGLGPFHDDKRPSFSVNQDKGLWNCKGCGKKGTIVVIKTNKQIGRGDNRKVDIIGKCSVCGTIVYRFSSLKTYKQFLQYYPQNIEESNDATKI